MRGGDRDAGDRKRGTEPLHRATRSRRGGRREWRTRAGQARARAHESFPGFVNYILPGACSPVLCPQH